MTLDSKIILSGRRNEKITITPGDPYASMFEQLLFLLDVDFEYLPLLVLGDSKEIRLLTPKIALAKLLPTVYSYTNNRYGIAPGTDMIRTLFSAELFRQLRDQPGAMHIGSAYPGLVRTKEGFLLAEQVFDSCNIEVRAKRFHIGSPLHCYLNTEKHTTRNNGTDTALDPF